MTEQQKKILSTIVYYAALGAALFFCVKYLLSWLLPFVLGTGIAALMRPSTLRLSARFGMHEKGAAVLTLLFFYIVAAGVLALFFTIVLAQLYDLLLQLPELCSETLLPLFTRMNLWFDGLAQRAFPETGGQLQAFSSAVSEAVRQAAVDGSTHLVGWLASLAAKLPMLLLTSIFTIVISAMTATGYRGIGAFLRAAVPKRAAATVTRLQHFLRETLWQFVRAYTILMAITFLELAAGLWILGFDYVLPVAAMIALVDLLPLIGSGTVLVPWGLILLAGGDLAGGAGLLILFGIITVMRNILEPKIVSARLGLHPVATITAMYAGLRIAGPAGLFAAPVLLLTIDRLLWHPREQSSASSGKASASM